MKCRECGCDARVLETRERHEGYITARRRTCPNNHIFWTFEIDDSLEHTILQHAANPNRIGGLISRATRWARNQKIVQQVLKGEKHEVIAREHDLSNNMVTTIANRMGIYTRPTSQKET